MFNKDTAGFNCRDKESLNEYHRKDLSETVNGSTHSLSQMDVLFLFFVSS